jgi:hypothetical protein
LGDEEGKKVAARFAEAIVRAYYSSPKRDIDILFPMVRSGDEADAALALVRGIEERVRKDLGIRDDDKRRIRIGGMIETKEPPQVWRSVIERFDFISVGTNDFISALRGRLSREGSIFEIPDTVLPLEFLTSVSDIYDMAAELKKELFFCGEWSARVKTMCELLSIAKAGKTKVTITAKPERLPRLAQIARNADLDAIFGYVIPLIAANNEKGVDRALEAIERLLEQKAALDSFDHLVGETRERPKKAVVPAVPVETFAAKGAEEEVKAAPPVDEDEDSRQRIRKVLLANDDIVEEVNRLGIQVAVDKSIGEVILAGGAPVVCGVAKVDVPAIGGLHILTGTYFKNLQERYGGTIIVINPSTSTPWKAFALSDEKAMSKTGGWAFNGDEIFILAKGTKDAKKVIGLIKKYDFFVLWSCL